MPGVSTDLRTGQPKCEAPCKTIQLIYELALGSGQYVHVVEISDNLLLTQHTTQLMELANLHAHITLRNLRPPGTKVRAIPYGFGFNWVSCPNYLWEILGWAVIGGMTNSIAGNYLSYLFEWAIF